MVTLSSTNGLEKFYLVTAAHETERNVLTRVKNRGDYPHDVQSCLRKPGSHRNLPNGIYGPRDKDERTEHDRNQREHGRRGEHHPDAEHGTIKSYISLDGTQSREADTMIVGPAKPWITISSKKRPIYFLKIRLQWGGPKVGEKMINSIINGKLCCATS